MQKKYWKAETIRNIRHVSDVTLSDDGRWGAYVCSQGTGDGSFRNQLFLIDMDSFCIREVRLEDDTNMNLKSPVFVDGGKSILFLCDKSGEYQIYKQTVGKENILQITSARHGVKRYSAHESGNMITFETTIWPGEVENHTVFTEMLPDEKLRWIRRMDNEPYYVTTLMYKQDDWYGMRKGERQAVGIVSMDGCDQQLIDTGEMETEFPTISFDGKRLAYFGYPHRHTKERTAELFVYDLDTGEQKQLSETVRIHQDGAPVFTRDSQNVIVSAIPRLRDQKLALLPYIISVETGTGKFLLNPEKETVCHGWHVPVTNHTIYGNHQRTVVIDDKLYFLSSWRGRENVYMVRTDSADEAEIELRSDGDIHGFDVDERGNLLFAEGTLAYPAEVYYQKKGGEKIQVSCENKWMDSYEVAKTEEFFILSKDRKVELQVWLTHPVNRIANTKYPAVLYIHGGPACTYTADFWHEAQVLAAAGIAVIYSNPRGSAGYGQEFCGYGYCWKQEAVDDLLSAVDASVEKGFIDADKVGVTGGSYGGFMTNKLNGTTERFVAAVSQRSLINLVTSYGTGDMGFWSDEPGHEEKSLLEFFKDRKNRSLIRYIDNMKIPLLILHGYRDQRCGFEQAEQLFVAMKDRNPEVPVRLVMFPGENHQITRTGKVQNQIRHLHEMVEWFKKYLEKGEDHEHE